MLFSAALVVVLFVLVHLALLGTVSWQGATDETELNAYSLPAAFMRRVYGQWAVKAVTVCLIGSCFASAFAGLLGYSRIPFGAASGTFLPASPPCIRSSPSRTSLCCWSAA